MLDGDVEVSADNARLQALADRLAGKLVDSKAEVFRLKVRLASPALVDLGELEKLITSDDQKIEICFDEGARWWAIFDGPYKPPVASISSLHSHQAAVDALVAKLEEANDESH